MKTFADSLTEIVAQKRRESAREESGAAHERKRSRLLKPALSDEDAPCRRLEERLVAVQELESEDLPELLKLFADSTPAWSDGARRLRSAALLISHVSHASATCCEDFVPLGGLVLLGEVLHEAVDRLQASTEEDTLDAGMSALACLKCLQSLPLLDPPKDQLIFSNLMRLQGLRRAASEAPALGGIAELRKRAADICHHWHVNALTKSRVQATPRPLFCTSPLPTSSTSPMPGTGDVLRSKATELIAQGLLATSEGRAMAEKVEVALFLLHGGATPKYRQHARMLKSNLALPGNEELCARLLSGSMPVEELVAMDSTALAPEALQEERRAAEEKVLRQSLIPSFMLSPMEMEDEDHRLVSSVSADSLTLRFSTAHRIGGA